MLLCCRAGLVVGGVEGGPVRRIQRTEPGSAYYSRGLSEPADVFARLQRGVRASPHWSDKLIRHRGGFRNNSYATVEKNSTAKANANKMDSSLDYFLSSDRSLCWSQDLRSLKEKPRRHFASLMFELRALIFDRCDAKFACRVSDERHKR